jgi:RNA polymerase sigma-70 factor (ECF subfamily)
MGHVSRERQQRFELLFEAHHAHIAAYARRRAPSEAVEDVVEETFLVAWRALEHVPDEPLPWLYGVARRVLANSRRGGGRAAALVQRLAQERESAEAAPSAPGLSAHVEAALRALSDREREAVLLIAWEGLTPSQRAIAAGCSAAAFRVRLHRARSRLARALKDPIAPVGEEGRLDPLKGAERS